MKAVDTNILVYALRQEMPESASARAALKALAQGPEPWALPWPCAYEFLRVVTHPRIFRPATPLKVALAALQALLDAPNLVSPVETRRHLALLQQTLAQAPVVGDDVFDAHVATLLREHGVEVLLTHDGGFQRYPGLRVVDPVAS
jgi:toxin-antitoxin system PIN domain toxin